MRKAGAPAGHDHKRLWLWVPCFRRDDDGAEPLNQQIAEIAPFKVLALDQLDLPITLPSFQLLLPGDRLVRALIGFDIDEAMNAVGFDK